MRIVNLILAFLVFLLPIKSAIAKPYSHYKDECEPLRPVVESILEDEGLSKNYFYLLVAESHCRNDKVSKAGAVGYWQMMPYTAKKFGCDRPLDLKCQTHAAANYIKHLEAKCGVEHTIYCWHDGGSNFLRKKRKPTVGAKGLNKQYLRFRKEANENT